MQYREMGKTGVKVSVLGMGCMRLPQMPEPAHEAIDEAESIRMIRAAIDGGVNYIDTAYFYHNGNSELLVGKALADGYREKVSLATKSPLGQINEPEDFERVLAKQLEKLQTGYVDFYMFHGIDREEFDKKVLGFNLIPRMEKAKADGLIRHIGFSFHDNAEAFRYIVDGYDGWEFCQVQMNYIDVENQATMKGVEYAAQKGLGVIVMEPLLGGKLAVPPEQVAKLLDSSRPAVEWALDFVWDRPEVSLLLSGMSTMEMIVQNLAYADKAAPGMLNAEQHEMLAGARKIFQTMARVPCTACRYCMPCPAGLDIPGIYELYNRSVVAERRAREDYAALAVKADACLQCGKCQSACPQDIDPLREMPLVTEYFK